MNERTLVLYDGACRFCRWAIEWIDRRDRHGVLDFCPFGHPVAEAKLSALSAETRYEQMPVVRNGRLVSRTLAARAILRKLPGGRLAVAVGLHRVIR